MKFYLSRIFLNILSILIILPGLQAGTVIYEYDARDRLISTEYNQQETISYNYDNANNLTLFDTARCNGTDSQILNLSVGWNLLSTHLLDCRTVLDLKSVLNVQGDFWTWDNVTEGFIMEDDTSHLIPDIGYFAFISETTQAVLSGIDIDYSIELKKGWNMIGAPSVSMPTSDVLNAVDGSIIWHWTGSKYEIASQWIPGKGYWLHSTFAGTLAVNIDSGGNPTVHFSTDHKDITGLALLSIGNEDANSNGLKNLQELSLGQDLSLYDSDGDGMSDQWETDNGLNPDDGSDAGFDSDSDGLTNFEEYIWRTNPNNFDSDSNGVEDFDDIGLHYTVTATDYSWVDISSIGTAITTWIGGTDDGYASVPIGFDYSFYKISFNGLYVNNNGLLLFGGSSTSYYNRDIPYTGGPNGFLATFWDDLKLAHNSNAVVLYHTRGTPGSREFIVTWKDIPFYSDSSARLTFQAILREGSNKITVQFQSMMNGTTLNSDGRSATLGLESNIGAEGIKYAYNQIGTVYNGFALAYTRQTDPYKVDFDMDGMSDGWEEDFNLDIYDAADAGIDLDGDGLTNLEEYLYATDPTSADTDGNGINDYNQLGIVYVAETTTFDWIDISATGTEIANWTIGGPDDGYTAVPVGFDFALFGDFYNQSYVSTNGVLTFDSGTTNYLNYNIPNGGFPHKMIAVFWDDLTQQNIINAKTLYKTQGLPGNRKFIITWENVAFYLDSGAQCTFQAILHESTNEIVVQFQSMVNGSRFYADGQSATLGVQDISGSDGTKFSYDQAGSVYDGLAIKYRRTATATAQSFNGGFRVAALHTTFSSAESEEIQGNNNDSFGAFPMNYLGENFAINKTQIILGGLWFDDQSPSQLPTRIFGYDGKNWIIHSPLLANSVGDLHHKDLPLSPQENQILLTNSVTNFSDPDVAYLYQFENNQWTLVSTIPELDINPHEYQQELIDIDGDLVLIGVQSVDENLGRYQKIALLKNIDSHWINILELQPDDFGVDSIARDSLNLKSPWFSVGGSTLDERGNNQVQHHVFIEEKGEIVQLESLLHLAQVEKQKFGTHTALGDGRIVIQADHAEYLEDGSLPLAYIYTYKDGELFVESTLTAKDVMPADANDFTLNIEGGLIMVTAYEEARRDKKRNLVILLFDAYRNWTEVARLTLKSNGNKKVYRTIAMAGKRIVIGEYRAKKSNSELKSVTVYEFDGLNLVEFGRLSDIDTKR